MGAVYKKPENPIGRSAHTHTHNYINDIYNIVYRLIVLNIGDRAYIDRSYDSVNTKSPGFGDTQFLAFTII